MDKQQWAKNAIDRIDNMSREEFIEALEKAGFFKEKKAPKLPMQPLVLTDSGVIRFMENKIVSDLYDFAVERGFGMNQIVISALKGKYTKDEQMQFAQLIGYSFDGYSTLSYVSDESCDEAEEHIKQHISLEQG